MSDDLNQTSAAAGTSERSKNTEHHLGPLVKEYRPLKRRAAVVGMIFAALAVYSGLGVYHRFADDGSEFDRAMVYSIFQLTVTTCLTIFLLVRHFRVRYAHHRDGFFIIGVFKETSFRWADIEPGGVVVFPGNMITVRLQNNKAVMFGFSHVEKRELSEILHEWRQ